MALVALVLLATTVVAEENKPQEKAPAITGTITNAIRTGYLCTLGIKVHSGLVAESELKLRLWETGFYLDVWGCVPFQKKRVTTETAKVGSDSPSAPDETTQSIIDVINAGSALANALHPRKAATVEVPFEGEVDYGIGYQFKLGNWSFDQSFILYDFNRLGHLNDDQWTSQSSIAYEGWEQTKPWVKVNWYGHTGHLSPPDSLFAYVGVDQTIPLFKRYDDTWQELALSASVALSDGKMVGNPGLVYAKLEASTEFKLGESWSLTPSLTYQRRLCQGDFADKNEVVGGVAISFTF